MPSYFFHLNFELYPFQDPAATASPWKISPHVYLPPPDTDIFTAAFPSHKSHRQSLSLRAAHQLPANQNETSSSLFQHEHPRSTPQPLFATLLNDTATDPS